MRLLLFCTVIILALYPTSSQKNTAIQFLKQYDKMADDFKMFTEASWKASTNITDHNSKLKNEVKLKLTEKMQKLREEASEIDLTDVDEDTRRQFRILLTTKTSKNMTITRLRSEVGTKMSTIYSTGTIPYDPKLIKSIKVDRGVKELTLNKHLYAILAKSTDPDELLYVWKSWRDSVGPKAKDLYTEYVRLNNIGAREHGYKDVGEYKKRRYEVDDVEKIAESFLEDMQPLYSEVHAYVRYRLSKIYPGIVREDDLLPAHLLGNMWAQNWNNIYEHVIPFPDESPLDITPVLKEKLTVKKMFKMAEEFFMSLGWQKLPRKFWTHSMFVEPKDRKVACHASAWDFRANDNGEPEVRVKMCTRMTQDHFNTIHHELGHNYYQLLYWNRPMIYRAGANPGFHEAVGDTIKLSVATPAHLNKVGLLKQTSSTREAEINFLLKSSLNSIVFLPFAFLMDKWMWHVYNGDIKPEQYNAKWWEYRMKYQGVKPPVERSENDFDPGAKMHIVNGVTYVRYFFAEILMFVFHEQACKLANHTGPLHQCSIYNSKEAGKGLGDMLALGRSKPWPDVLKQYTGSPNISTSAIKEYYKPLTEWLESYRTAKQYKLGW